MKKSRLRIQSILAISFSVLVVLICFGGSAVIWVLGGTTSSVAAQLLGAVDKTAQIMRDGIARMDAGIVKLEESVSTVEDASVQLSQNVNDKGVVLVLLPTTKEQELTSAAQSVRDDFASIRDYLNATQEMVQAINRLPFIDLPELASVEPLQTQVTTMSTQVEELKNGIGEARSQTAANISKITETTANLNNQLASLRSDLATTDKELGSIQFHARQLQKLLSTILLLIEIAVTLMAIWIGYSQFVMINRALSRVRILDDREVANIEEDSEESASRGIQSTTSDETEQRNSTQTEVEE